MRRRPPLRPLPVHLPSLPVAAARRVLLGAAALACLSPLAALADETAQRDTRPIEWVVGYAAGGGSDIVARSLAEPMGKSLNRNLVINNKPGGATNIAATYVARSKDPTHVLLTADFATLAANPSLFSALPYDPDKDFVAVGLLARFPLLLVVAPNVPANDYREFLAWAKQHPDGLNFASAGVGSPHHLAGELFAERAGLKLVHTPYRGAGPAVQDLLGGQVPFGFMDTASVQQYLAAGKLKAIGVASPQRLAAMGSIPTLAEQGLDGFEAFAWQGLVAPAGTDAEAVRRLNGVLVAALASPGVKERFAALALEAMPGSPEEMAAYVKTERERWGRLIKAKGIRVD